MSTLRVLTLNMQNGQVWNADNPDGAPIDLDQTIAFLAQEDADIVFLQEVEFPPAELGDTHSHPNYDRLRHALGQYYGCFTYPAATRPHLPFGIGLAILSKLPLGNDFHVILPPADFTFQFQGNTWLPTERSILGASVELDGQTVTLLNTHLQAYFMIDASSDKYPAQRHILSTLVRGIHGPLVLAGDFNCTSQESTIDEIESLGLKSIQKDTVTWHRIPLVLDHIFYSSHFTPGSYRVIHADVSDHDALKAELSLAISGEVNAATSA